MHFGYHLIHSFVADNCIMLQCVAVRCSALQRDRKRPMAVTKSGMNCLGVIGYTPLLPITARASSDKSLRGTCSFPGERERARERECARERGRAREHGRERETACKRERQSDRMCTREREGARRESAREREMRERDSERERTTASACAHVRTSKWGKKEKRKKQKRKRESGWIC